MLHVHITLQSREFSIQNPILHTEDKSSSSTTTTFQRAKRPSFQKRNSTHRRQGDLLEMHPCVLQNLPMTFQAFQSFMTFQPFQAILQCSSISRESTPFQHSPIRMHILQFYNSYSSIGFHRKLHRVPVGQLQTLHSFFKEREMLQYQSN